MKQRTGVILLAVLTAVLVAAAVWIWIGVLHMEPADDQIPETTQAATEPSTEAADQARDITVFTADGEAVKLSDFKGKPVVLNFWASWCGPCKQEMPAFEAAYQSQGDEVQFLMVNLTDSSRETVEVASGFIADAGYTFPVFYDTTYTANMAYEVTAIPATFFIDAEGRLVDSHVGAMDAAALQSYLDKIA